MRETTTREREVLDEGETCEVDDSVARYLPYIEMNGAGARGRARS